MQICLGPLEECKTYHVDFTWPMTLVMHNLASQMFKGVADAYSAWEIPSRPYSTNCTPLAGHALQIFSECRDSITRCDLPDPDVFAMHTRFPAPIPKTSSSRINCKNVWVWKLVMLKMNEYALQYAAMHDKFFGCHVLRIAHGKLRFCMTDKRAFSCLCNTGSRVMPDKHDKLHLHYSRPRHFYIWYRESGCEVRP